MSDIQNLERQSMKGVASKLCQGPVVRSLELVTLWAMSLGLLGGCNLANYDGQQVEVVVDVVEVSETLRAERAELSQGADGLFRPLVHQDFEVKLEAVKRRKVRRQVHDTGPVDWILSEAFLDPFLALIAILDSLPQVDESESSNSFRSLPGWPLSGVAAVLPGITHAPYPKETRVVRSVSEIERRPADAKDRSVLVDEGLRVFAGGQLIDAKGGAVSLRGVCDSSFGSGGTPLVEIELDGRRYDVRISEQEAAIASAALEEGDLRWARALEFHAILFSLPAGSKLANELLVGARDAGAAPWMAAMGRDEWEVVASEGKVRMADGAVVDFRAPTSRVGAASSSRSYPAQLTLTMSGLDDVSAGGSFGVKVSVENPTSEAAYQVLAVLEGQGVGLLNVPVGAVMPGTTVSRFVQLQAGEDAHEDNMTGSLVQWPPTPGK